MASANDEPAMNQFAKQSSSAHNLLTIPPEITELIAEEVEIYDLLPLRLVSRETAQRVLRTFVKTHFTKRAFILGNEESLRTLLSIAEHEIFAPSLERIDLCIEEIPAPDHPVQLDGQQEAPETSESVESGISEKQEKEWKITVQKQTTVKEQNIDLHLLTMAFIRLRRWRNLKDVRVVDRELACETPQGWDTLEQSTGQTMVWREDNSRPVQYVLDALKMSLSQIESFIVEFDDFLWSFHTLVHSIQNFTNTDWVFRGVKRLHLEFDTAGLVPTQNHALRFISCLLYATAVEDLAIHTASLSWAAEDPASHFKMVEGLCHCLRTGLPNLVALDLEGFYIPKEDLLSILSHRRQLKRLHYHAELDHPTDWDEEFCIAEEVSDENGWPVNQSDLDKFSVECKRQLPVHIMSCTMIEWLAGSDAWWTIRTDSHEG